MRTLVSDRDMGDIYVDVGDMQRFIPQFGANVNNSLRPAPNDGSATIGSHSRVADRDGWERPKHW